MLDKSKVEQFITAAMKYLGDDYSIHYRLEPGRSDCSSIIEKALSAIKLNDYPGRTISTKGIRDGDSRFTEIPMKDAQRGDILWWQKPNTDKYQGHVAILLGDGKVLEAIYTGVSIQKSNRLNYQKAYRIKTLMKGGNMTKKIMLDPGHYEGYNRFNGGSEGSNNWEVCIDLKKELERFGFIVGLSKPSIGANPSLEARGRAGQGYDLLLSIHSNAGGGSGVEVFDDTNPKYSNKKLADAICKAIATSLNLPNRGVKYRKNNSGSNYYGVLRNQYAKSGMIVELFFHDSQKDLDAFKANRDLMIKNIATAVANHYGLTSNRPVPPTPTQAKKKVIENVEVFVNGKPFPQRGYIVDGVTYVDIKGKDGKVTGREVREYFEKGFGAEVTWDGKSVHVRY